MDRHLVTKARAVWAQIAPWIGYLFFQAGDVSDGLKKIAESRGHVDQALANFLASTDDGQTQIFKAVAAAKEVAGKQESVTSPKTLLARQRSMIPLLIGG